MNSKQKHLQRIVNRRTEFMNKRWDAIDCDFNDGVIRVSFINDDSDFSKREYTDIEDAIKDQTDKLRRDIINLVGKNKDVEQILKYLLT